MRQQMFALSLGFVALILAVENAYGAPTPPCAPRPQVAGLLLRQYGETARALGLAANGTLVEVFAADSGSWTITVTSAGGDTCLVASGTDFQTLTAPPRRDGERSAVIR